jgi:hypothetical protein
VQRALKHIKQGILCGSLKGIDLKRGLLIDAIQVSDFKNKGHQIYGTPG